MSRAAGRRHRRKPRRTPDRQNYRHSAGGMRCRRATELWRAARAWPAGEGASLEGVVGILARRCQTRRHQTRRWMTKLFCWYSRDPLVAASWPCDSVVVTRAAVMRPRALRQMPSAHHRPARHRAVGAPVPDLALRHADLAREPALRESGAGQQVAESGGVSHGPARAASRRAACAARAG